MGRKKLSGEKQFWQRVLIMGPKATSGAIEKLYRTFKKQDINGTENKTLPDVCTPCGTCELSDVEKDGVGCPFIGQKRD